MAIYKRKGRKGISYQVKVLGSDGCWISKTFNNQKDAKKFEANLVSKKHRGEAITNVVSTTTLSDFFWFWHHETKDNGPSPGWRNDQIRNFETYVGPIIGDVPLGKIVPNHINKVIGNARRYRSPQTCIHIYNLLHKVFSDAIDEFELLAVNPVKKRHKPKNPLKESKHLTAEQSRNLLLVSKGRPFGLAVWLGLLAGMRVGEIQALKWSCIDLKKQLIHIRATYVRKEKRMKDFPKGGNWHSVKAPTELISYLREEKIKASSVYVVSSVNQEMMSYHSYYDVLGKFCEEAGIPKVPTHALRHSAAEIYMESGATRDDLRILFNHSSSSVTDRYVHDKGERLAKVAEVIRVGVEA